MKKAVIKTLRRDIENLLEILTETKAKETKIQISRAISHLLSAIVREG